AVLPACFFAAPPFVVLATAFCRLVDFAVAFAAALRPAVVVFAVAARARALARPRAARRLPLTCRPAVRLLEVRSAARSSARASAAACSAAGLPAASLAPCPPGLAPPRPVPLS